MHSPANSAPSAWIVETQHAPEVRIWGLTPSDRQRRLLARAGCETIRSLNPDDDPGDANGRSVMLVRSDAILDERLVQGLFAAQNTVLVAEVERGGWGGPVAAHVEAPRAAEALATLRRAATGEQPSLPASLRAAAPNDISPAYSVKLRKFDPPCVYPARLENAREIEDRLYAASYKGVTDLITKWLWPRPAAEVVRLLARSGVKPNTVTAVSWVLTVAAGVLFWEGAFGLGLVCGWLMTFLDTVDGKLARVTLTSSRIGHVLDHGLDNVHPPFWYLAWGVGLHGGVDATTAIVVIGYLIGRGLEAVFILTFKIETHCWRPIDSLFRTITARRNPNLILLTVGALGGRPDLGLVMVAIWTVVSIGFHIERVAQAYIERSRGIPIERWDEMPGADPDHEAPAGSGTSA